MNLSTALLTDRYELTMIDAAIHAKTANRQSIFELFARRLEGQRRYGVVAGTGRLLDALTNFKFGEDELAWLDSEKFLSDETLNFLADFTFQGTIHGYREGEVFFPGSPLLVVEGTFAEGVLLETLALSIFNHDSAVATAASRMVTAANGKPLAEMGSRRTGESSAIAAARAAYIAGFDASSNLEAGRTYGIPTMGTAAHSFTLLHDSERDAFFAQISALGSETTLLIDTFDIPEGVRRAIEVAGTSLEAVRIDSGDLPTVVEQVRGILDSLGARETKITVTNDLDEFTVAALASSPVDNFGVGTSVVTGSGTPTLGMVYKLVAREGNRGWESVAKSSSQKASRGGLKHGTRLLNSQGIAEAEVIYDRPLPPSPRDHLQLANHRDLMVQLVANGIPNSQHLGHEGLMNARKRHTASVRELPIEAARLTQGDPVIPTVFTTR